MSALPDFGAFFRQVHGAQPFPWQARAAQALARRQTFAVAVPTGLGKSALVDAAIWAAAHGAWRRIAFVVDRRIVVDAVHDRALRIQQALDDPDRPTSFAALAERLGEMQVVRLRGGVFGDDDWVLYPERVTVALTTVDQLGSRLLFRGYGVAPRRWPLHAGFFASDTLVIVDEAHLSAPFLSTLERLRSAGADVAVVPMSATLAKAPGVQVLALEADDLALPQVQQRLAARKPARRVVAGPAEADLVKTLATEAVGLAAGAGVERIGVVVNRVATARRCHDWLTAQGHEAALLTGRVRPAERDRQLAELLPRIQTGRARGEGAKPLFVVATQTIEVGADLDFDALVTECAPLSSLRQRFGRLDRLGLRGESDAVVVLRSSKEADDPVYGAGLLQAWEWLTAVAADSGGAVDLGLAAMDSQMARWPAPAEPQQRAATLLPTHLGMLAQTGSDAPQMDLGAWLHGPSDRAPDVTLVWRDDLLPGQPDGWAAAVQLLPPMAREALSLPAPAVRRWLSDARPGEQWSDTDGAADDDTLGPRPERPVLRWRGADDCHVVTARDIRPGDTLILPSAYGGCDVWGWAPDSLAPVPDLADLCLQERLAAGATRRAVLRVTEGHWSAWGDAAGPLQTAIAHLAALQQAAQDEPELEDELQAARQQLVALVLASGHPLAQGLTDARLETHPLGHVVRGRGTEELEGVIETGRAVALDVHHADVARWAYRLAHTDPARAAIVDAARIHDAGKAERRMQSLLHGSPLKAAGGPLLAKSALRSRDQQLAAWKASALPRGFRHEFASLDVAAPADGLVRHLTATHHGYGRPWVPPCQDPAAPGAAHAGLAAHWLAAWHLQLTRHGPWALARMEWLLRAADARASIEEAADGAP
jgi:CRISPR-associated endonuclease/helicase Cas3